MLVKIGSISQLPRLTLDAWMAFRVPFDGLDRPWTLHLTGWRVETTRGRVSSPVEWIDPATRRALTRSGSVYELRHGPGLNPDALATWALWKSIHQVRHEDDVSEQLASILLDALH